MNDDSIFFTLSINENLNLSSDPVAPCGLDKFNQINMLTLLELDNQLGCDKNLCFSLVFLNE